MAENKSTYSKLKKGSLVTLSGVAIGSISAAAVAGEIANHDPTSLLSLTDIAATAGISVATYFALEFIADKYFEDHIKELEELHNQGKITDKDYAAEMKSIKREKMMIKMLIRSSIPIAMVTAAAWEGKDWNEYLEHEIPGTNLEYGELFILSIAGFILAKLIEAIQNKRAEKQQLAEQEQPSEQRKESEQPNEEDIAVAGEKVTQNI